AEGPRGAAYRLAGGACLPAAPGGPPAQGAMLCIRPEKWRLVNPERAAIAGRIASTSFIGDRTEYWIDTAFGQIAAVELNAAVRRPGEAVGLEVAAHDIRIIGE
ncbi:MAG: TOBE domain-containing protein, partial [Pollutimonas bauzanensis]